MPNIIPVDRSHAERLVQIDIESEHQGDKNLVLVKEELLKEVLARFSEGHEIFFGYELNGELVGYVTLKPFFPGYKHCEVYWLAVKHKYQGQGIGTKLMEFIEKYAKEKGFRKVCLYTGKDMAKTRHFYEKIGYAFVNEFKDYYGYSKGNTTGVLYCKNI